MEYLGVYATAQEAALRVAKRFKELVAWEAAQLAKGREVFSTETLHSTLDFLNYSYCTNVL